MKEFNIEWKIENDVPVLYMNGDITTDADVHLLNTYNEIRKINKNQTMIFDFFQSDYINSSGISAVIKLLHIHKEYNGDFIFIRLSDHFKKVMSIMGLTDYITIYDSKEQAFKNI